MALVVACEQVGSSIIITWSGSTIDPDTYWLVRDGATIETIVSDDLTYTDEDVEEGECYDYKIVAINGLTESVEESNTVNICVVHVGWSWYSGKACYIGESGGEVLTQASVMTPGNYYVVKFTINGQTQGKLRVASLSGTHVYEEDGTYVVYGTATVADLIFIADLDENDAIFNGCIDSVECYNFSQLEEFATSPCLQVQSDDGCLVLIEATNDTDALGFNWDDLTLSARIDAKFAKVEYKTDMETSTDSEGNKTVIYFDGNRVRSLLVQAAPTYIHDFLYMCMAVDGFSINGTDYVMQNEEYPSIKWNSRFLEGTVELLLRKKIAKLNKTNCG